MPRSGRAQDASSFNSHAPVGARSDKWQQSRKPKGFNSHAPVGARYLHICQGHLHGVSIHTPPWGRDKLNIISARMFAFQFTRPRGGAMPCGGYGPALERFNSHAPVGARCLVVDMGLPLSVSIHTPPWGRDEKDAKILALDAVSIHTPPWGRDRKRRPRMAVSVFQFTRPRGGAISRSDCLQVPRSFNSHAPVGARLRVERRENSPFKFQFTRPRGGAIGAA